MMTRPSKVNWTVKNFPAELKDRLKVRAREERRTIIAMLEIAVSDYLDTTSKNITTTDISVVLMPIFKMVNKKPTDRTEAEKAIIAYLYSLLKVKGE